MPRTYVNNSDVYVLDSTFGNNESIIVGSLRAPLTSKSLDDWYIASRYNEYFLNNIGDLRSFYDHANNEFRCQYYSGTEWLDVQTT
jgi:hypothetical protein